MVRPPPELYGFSISEIAQICRVSLKTASRWKAGQTVPPATSLMILSGDLGILDPLWSGWRVRGGALFSPEGWEITRGDVLAVPLERRALETARAEVRRMKQDLTAQEQPLPDSWPEWVAKLGA